MAAGAGGEVGVGVVGLGGEEGFRAAALNPLADVALAPALGAAVHGGGVDVVDAEVEGALDDGDSRRVVVRLLDGRLPAETEKAGAVAGAAEVAGGHCVGRGRVRRQRRGGFGGFRHEPAREKAGSGGGAELPEIPTPPNP